MEEEESGTWKIVLAVALSVTVGIAVRRYLKHKHFRPRPGARNGGVNTSGTSGAVPAPSGGLSPSRRSARRRVSMPPTLTVPDFFD